MPEGSLFVYDPVALCADPDRRRVLTTAVAPTLLSHFGVPRPDDMDGETIDLAAPAAG